MSIKLSANARIALRKAITNHPQWNNAFRTLNNYSLHSMSRDDYFEAARLLGIDVAEIARTADSNSTPAPVRPNGHDKTAEAKKAFDVEDMEDRAKDKDPRVEKIRDAHDREIAGDKAGQLMRLIAELAGNSIDTDTVRKIVREEMENNPTGTVRHVIEVERKGIAVAEISGQHKEFARLLRMASARNKDGVVPGIFLPGPAGSGKTYAANKVADVLELPFHFNGSIGMTHELLGFIDANGFYHRTPFREAYENGGVYCFDEVDGSDNAAILALNAALANGKATFPDAQVKRHKDFIVIATANTWGMGANADYVGRAKLDGAFLDRFPCRLFWDYDTDLEVNLSGNAAFAARVQIARSNAKSAGLKVLITPRATMAGAALIEAGFTADEAADLTYRANLTDEQKRMIK